MEKQEGLGFSDCNFDGFHALTNSGTFLLPRESESDLTASLQIAHHVNWLAMFYCYTVMDLPI